MKIALTQMDIVWEEKEKNKAVCERLVREAARHQAELIVFPEMTLTGFTMKPEKYGENQKNNKTERFFQALSAKYETAIIFGYIEEKEGRYYNMLALTDGSKILMKYAKIHPFSYGEESRHYSGGKSVESTRFQDLFIGGFICYDLRFPEIFQISSKRSEVIFVIANWPESRAEHWSTLLKARAIENQCYIAGINRTGEGNGLHYQASSMVFDPYGRRIEYREQEKCIYTDKTELLYADIDAQVVREYRKEFSVKSDRRENLYRELNKNLSGFQVSFHLLHKS